MTRLLFILAVPLFSLLADAAQANWQQNATYFPLRTQAFLYINLTGFEREDSVLSSIPRDELFDYTYDDLTRHQLMTEIYEGCSGSTEAAFKLILDERYRERFTEVAFGVYNAGIGISQNDYTVLHGRFTREQAREMLQSHTGRENPEEEFHGSFRSLSGKKVLYYIPEDNLILLSNDESWIQIRNTGESYTRLTDADSSFSEMVTLLDNSEVDMLFYLDKELFDMATENDPMAAMLLGPFLRSRGTIVRLTSGEKRILDGRVLCESPSAAETAIRFFEQLQGLSVAQLQSIAQRRTASKENNLAQLFESYVKSVRVLQEGSQAICRLEFRRDANHDTIRESVAADFQDDAGWRALLPLIQLLPARNPD